MSQRITHSSGDVFRDLGFDVEEAQDLRLRSDLMIALRERIGQLRESQAVVAKQLGVTQPRISDLMRGKIHLFSLDSLTHMLGRLGATVDVTVRVPASASQAVSPSAMSSTCVVSTTQAITIPQNVDALCDQTVAAVQLMTTTTQPTETISYTVRNLLTALQRATTSIADQHPHGQATATANSELAKTTRLALAA